MIRERMGEQDRPGIDASQQQQRQQMGQQPMRAQHQQQQQPQQQFQQLSDSGVMEVDMIHQERRKAMEAMEEAMNVQQQMRRYESLDDEEDFSCPPALETIEVQQQQLQAREQALIAQQREEAILYQSGEQQSFSQTIVRELALAIKESMQTYQDMGDNYEPSADELIDVLKNLENLAAINPALYRAIVDQIKTPAAAVESGSNDAHQHQRHVYDEEQANVNGLNDQEVPREDHQYEEINGNHGDDVVDLQHGMQNGHVDVAPQQMPQQMTGPPKSAEELKKEQQQELIRKQVEQEHEEMLRSMK